MSELEHCRLAHEGKLELFKEKVDTNKFENLAIKKDQNGRSGLHWACVGSKLDIVNYLREDHNVPLDEPDVAGWTPLMIASSVGCLQIVKTLLAANCDPNHPNENHQRPIHYAASKNHVEIAIALANAGADPNVADKYLSTPLHRASSKGNIKIVDMLLSAYKAKVDPTDIEGNSPLHLACEEERVETVKLLLKHNANPYLKNKNEETPVMKSNGALLSLI